MEKIKVKITKIFSTPVQLIVEFTENEPENLRKVMNHFININGIDATLEIDENS